MATLQRLPSVAAAEAWLRARGAGALRTDSREVRPGEAFVAWPGWASDGRRYVHDALAAGAVACLVEDEGVEAFGFDDARVASVAGLKAACGPLADAWFDRPSAHLDIVAATGTNGKTSTSCWTAEALARCGRRAGVIGTLGAGELGSAGGIVPTGLTTPDPLTLHRVLAGFVAQGVTACALEASSIGLVEHRLDGVRIDVALYTNFTRDHLDYHGTMDAYWAAKRRLFAWPGLRAAVIDVDDEHGAALAAELRGGALELWTVSAAASRAARRTAGDEAHRALDGEPRLVAGDEARLVAGDAPRLMAGDAPRLVARELRYTPCGLAFEVCEGSRTATLATAIVGEFNVGNLLVVVGALRALGVSLADACAALAHASPVPGRMQRVSGGDVDVVVDYAHTPDALAKVLAALRPLARARGGRLLCLFGCGGNRDATKRPLMGAIAGRDADRVFVTSDNPRDEPPAAILAQILAGVAGRDDVAVIEDRAEAIAAAIGEAQPGDVVLLAGKGHEAYQEAAGARRPFSDLEHARAALARRAGAQGSGAQSSGAQSSGA
ncbi:MAG TPA: UDP-N-acetylmuramoyl-L-alanyl-D-glutamate--2,6-diaminopimelate ligase, partial [Rubrivivax sp.]|nr:UDP-N-acetylmuramoyl-L-alanyl-D-glutamate--2,6-diaminopimelate ligase [Rubrivivax sp.]